ncbi:accessory Sec system protein Asp1 [Staphylococcus pragensis]|uniref:Accessory Sec system protein Asp1 n=1 Tax=Staphylococcus pragensis TaxID=1611836 RepID=A0A4Z1BNX2_9STAP|nr:accessory Sec system protein Asp1 [Staphylococcus pragensis]RTX90201.1 accessory Sec system protein Asp1 [Staphylococcus carnosus]TGN22311.1 accessory Sec system protein Asp1 [Staphylococcus pragensis]GGG98560.1 accessory Sec system protein Asp1 [Staphylococcus pragensis]
MKQFIPAWYDSTYWWDSAVEPFFRKKKVTEFDDMVSLLSMYRKNEETFTTLILNYQPMLRLFLHRHQLYEVTYWSLFDAIQGAQNVTPQAIDYRDLAWPEDTEFIYTSFQVIAITATNMYSKINFSQEGYLLWIEDFENEVLKRKFIFDDRGFISSIESYDLNSKPAYRDYLNVDGSTIMRQNFNTQNITIMAEYQPHFQKTEYNNMDELIHEKLSEFNDNNLKTNDKLIVAADERHNKLLNDIFQPENICYSLFTPRNKHVHDELLKSITVANQCVVDTQENERKIDAFVSDNRQSQQFNYMRITPFEAQMLPNISSQLYETNIGVWVDGLTDNELQSLMTQLAQYIYHHEKIKIILMTKSSNHEIAPWLKEEVQKINDSLNTENEELSLEVRDILETELENIEAIKIISVPFEEDLMKAISQLRIVIDLNSEPDLYLQISSISAGIPQINKSQTDYVEHKLNGLIIENMEQLHMALDYFLLNLKNWNYSFAHSIKLSENFSSKFIIQQLDSLIEGGTYGT